MILNMILLLLPSCLGFSFALGCGVSFLLGSSILLSMVVQQQVVILDFSQEKMSTCPSTLPFIISLLGDSVQSVMFNSLQPHGLYKAHRLFCPWNSLGKNTGVGSQSLLQVQYFEITSNSAVNKLVHMYFWVVGGLLSGLIPRNRIPGSKGVITFMTPVIGCLVVLQKDLTANRFSGLRSLEGELPRARTP